MSAHLIEDGGTRAHVMIFEYREGAPAYPQLTSAGLAQANGAPVGWGLYRGKGKVELADTGTLFLDEVGELPLEVELGDQDTTRSAHEVANRLLVIGEEGRDLERPDVHSPFPAAIRRLEDRSEGRAPGDHANVDLAATGVLLELKEEPRLLER